MKLFCKLKTLWNDFKSRLSRAEKVGLILLVGCIAGLGSLFLYTLRFTTYLGDDPAACMNCHVMAPYYATWAHSSHAHTATCNDCHVPHSSVFAKYYFKAKDGIGHVAAFVTKSEKDVIMLKEASAEVIMDNCIRCHTQLNTELVNTGRIDYMMAQRNEGKACWDCHRETPHGRVGLSSTSNAIVPYPPATAPQWLHKTVGGR